MSNPNGDYATFQAATRPVFDGFAIWPRWKEARDLLKRFGVDEKHEFEKWRLELTEAEAKLTLFNFRRYGNHDRMEWEDKTIVPCSGYEVFRWPEMVAFRQRLGYPENSNEFSSVYEFEEGKRPTMTLVLACREPKDNPTIWDEPLPPEYKVPAVDTTTARNEVFRTMQPGLKRV